MVTRDMSDTDRLTCFRRKHRDLVYTWLRDIKHAPILAEENGMGITRDPHVSSFLPVPTSITLMPEGVPET